MPDANTVTLERATSRDQTLLANLLELYCHDLSEVFPIAPNADGRFGYPRLPSYFSEPERRFAFLIRAGSALAGFALATIGSPLSSDPTDFDVAEFFVLRAQRRAGVGRQAAFLLWDQFPGHWVVRVSDGNRGALGFWPEVVSAYSQGQFTQTQAPGTPHGWQVFRFRSNADSHNTRPDTLTT
jgi:predicted acetyltransferase